LPEKKNVIFARLKQYNPTENEEPNPNPCFAGIGFWLCTGRKRFAAKTGFPTIAAAVYTNVLPA
jgi:hypothetical protein